MVACVSLLSRHRTASLFNRVLTSGFCTKLPSIPDISCHLRMLPLTPQDRLCTHARLCFVSGEQVIKWFIELLPTGQTVTGDLHSQQLERVQQAPRQKDLALVNRKGVLFSHDNARPHVARVVPDTIQQLGWETLCHPPYSPDLATTTTTVYFNEVVFPSVLGSTSPLAFP